MQFNICLPKFRLEDDRDMQVGDCASFNKQMGSKKATAFLSSPDDKAKAGGDITERTCKYTFQEPVFEGIKDTESDVAEKMKGYSLTYTSGEACDGGSKVSYKMNVLCKEDADDGRKFKVASSDKCAVEMNFEGPEGCSFDLDVTKYLAPLSHFFGLFEILIGVVICFFGSKFLPLTFSTLIFMMVNGIVFGISYNMQILVDPRTYEPNIPVIAGVAIVSVALGVAAGYYSYKFAKDYAVALLAGWCGGALMALILTPITALQGQVKVILIFVAVLLSIRGAQKVNRYIKSVGTAFIGAFLMMYGLGQELGGFPPIFSSAKDFDFQQGSVNGLTLSYVGYLVGFVVFTCFGGYVQLKYIVDTDEHTDDDDVFNQRHA